jgi:hypothetical protein
MSAFCRLSIINRSSTTTATMASSTMCRHNLTIMRIQPCMSTTITHHNRSWYGSNCRPSSQTRSLIGERDSQHYRSYKQNTNNNSSNNNYHHQHRGTRPRIIGMATGVGMVVAMHQIAFAESNDEKMSMMQFLLFLQIRWSYDLELVGYSCLCMGK